MTATSQSDLNAVDVFTHSSTGFPGAWTEEEIKALLDAWEEVLETSRRGRRLDVAQKIMTRLSDIKDFRRVEKDEIKRQISTLRTEYKVYQGLLQIGIPSVRAPCVDQLELILYKIPADRKRLYSDEHSEHSDNNRRPSVSNEDQTRQRNFSESNSVRNDENAAQRPRMRGPRRMTLQRMIRTMITQHQTLLETVDKLFNSMASFNTNIMAGLECILTFVMLISKFAGSTEQKSCSEASYEGSEKNDSSEDD